MKLQFDFHNEKIVFETYLQTGLKVVEDIYQHKYNAAEHAAKVEKVFAGILRKNVSELVAAQNFDGIESELNMMLEKLLDVKHEIEKGIKLCEQLQIEKEKSLLTIETTEK